MGDRILNHFFGDLVEGHPVGFLIRQVQKLLQMPGNGLSLPVRVGGEIHGIRLGGRFFQFLNQLFLPPDRLILGGEVVLQIHPHLAFGQIPQMAHAGLHRIRVSQIVSNGLGLGG